MSTNQETNEKPSTAFNDQILNNPDLVVERIQDQGFEWASNLLYLLGNRLGINVGHYPKEDHKVVLKLPDSADEVLSFVSIEAALLETEIKVTKENIIELRRRQIDAEKRLAAYNLMKDSLSAI